MPDSVLQGFGQPGGERLPLPADSAMSAAQRAAAQALIAGPRKGVYGPFLPLLRSPELLERMAKVGEYLRFDSVVDARIRELVTCATARHAGNQFEWVMHAPLARKAGVAEATLEALRAGARPKGLPADEELALDFTTELLNTNGASDATYKAAVEHFGEQGLVELTSLIGYFVMVNWLMNVARTPSLPSSEAPLTAFPS
jgi:4-carboxymuconolactone decarboxylase